MEPDIAYYLRIFRRRAWILVVFAIVIGGLGYYSAARQPVRYDSQATILVGGSFVRSDPTLSEIEIGNELVRTYARLAEEFSILNPTIEDLDLPLSVEGLRGIVSVGLSEDTSLLDIRVRYEDATLAATIANTIAEKLIESAPANLSDEEQAQVDFLQEYIEILNVQAQETRNQIESIDARIEATDDEEESQALVNERNVLVDQLNSASANIVDFTTTIVGLSEDNNQLTMFAQARVPTNPVSDGAMTRLILGLAFGISIGGGVIFILEYLDNTIHTSRGAAEVLNLPVLSSIARMKPGGSKLVTDLPRNSPVAQGFRTLQANLQLEVDTSTTNNIILVSSPNSNEGSSFVATNLALTLASSGVRTLLIDGVGINPNIHNTLSLQNERGLVELFESQVAANHEANSDSPDGSTLEDIMPYVQQYNETLFVITGGSAHVHSTPMLSSRKLKKLIDVLRFTLEVDATVIDVAPILEETDCSVLLSTLKATEGSLFPMKRTICDVALVLEADVTSEEAAVRAKEQLVHHGHVVKGAVLNKVNPKNQAHGYGYGYYPTQAAATQTLTQELRSVTVEDEAVKFPLN